MTLAVTKKPKLENPEEYRMTIGEHLEELRRRMILGMVGFVVATIVCMALGERVMIVFCKPYLTAARDAHVTPQFVYTQISEVFMNYLKVSLISALAIASPWMIYQLWQFVAAGLYTHERKVVTKYIPMSIGLLLTGMLFVYFFVMPLTIRWLLEFSSSVPVPSDIQSPTVQIAPDQVVKIPQFHGDPEKPVENQWWLNDFDGRLKFFFHGQTRVIQFGPERLFAPMISVGDYIDLMLMTLLTFGLAFQMPLVVLAIASIGIVDVQQLRDYRRYVYFAMSILAAVIAPGDVVSAMMALLIPLILLYELGIFMAWMGERKRAREEESS